MELPAFFLTLGAILGLPPGHELALISRIHPLWRNFGMNGGGFGSPMPAVKSLGLINPTMYNLDHIG